MPSGRYPECDLFMLFHQMTWCPKLSCWSLWVSLTRGSRGDTLLRHPRWGAHRQAHCPSELKEREAEIERQQEENERQREETERQREETLRRTNALNIDHQLEARGISIEEYYRGQRQRLATRRRSNGTTMATHQRKRMSCCPTCCRRTPSVSRKSSEKPGVGCPGDATATKHYR